MIVTASLLLPACRTLRMGRDVPLDLLGREAEDEPEPEVSAQPLTAGDGEAVAPAPSEAAVESVEPELEPEERVASVEPRSWLSGRQLTSEGTSGDGRWDADGAQIIFQSIRTGGVMANPNPQTWLMDADGERQRRITMGIGVTQGPGFVSVLAREVYYGSTHHTGETPTIPVGALPDEMELYRQNLDRGGFEQLTDSPGFDGDAAWCRQDGLVVFTSTRDGDPELYALADGQTTRITEVPGEDRAATLSPDCSRLAWVRDGALLVADADGSELTVLLPAGVEAPSWHPDGELLVFSATTAKGEPAELFTVRADGTDLRRLTASSGGEQAPSFSPDGTRLLYSWDRTGTRQLFVAAWDGSMGAPATLPSP